MMLQSAPILAFVPVSDLKAAEKFYVHTLGLAVAERTPFALVVANAAGQRLRCVLTPDAKPQPFTVAGWEVADIAASAKEFKAKHIDPIVYPHFEQDLDGIWTAPNGARVLWFHDPDSNVLSLTQGQAAAAK